MNGSLLPRTGHSEFNQKGYYCHTIVCLSACFVFIHYEVMVSILSDQALNFDFGEKNKLPFKICILAAGTYIQNVLGQTCTRDFLHCKQITVFIYRFRLNFGDFANFI